MTERKYNIRFPRILLFSVLLVFCNGFDDAVHSGSTALNGAWGWEDSLGQHIIVFTDSYFTNTVFSPLNKQAVVTQGGLYSAESDRVNTMIEFNSQESERVGQPSGFAYEIYNDTIKITTDSSEFAATRIDDGSAPLAGRWRITQRAENGQMTVIDSAARKTLKILSGTRFQWVAMNTDTREFFGTGGGTYTFLNGKYTENIEFFSNDSTRVGLSLSFDGKVENDSWHHSGLSSKGEEIHEVWTRVR